MGLDGDGSRRACRGVAGSFDLRGLGATSRVAPLNDRARARRLVDRPSSGRHHFKGVRFGSNRNRQTSSRQTVATRSPVYRRGIAHHGLDAYDRNRVERVRRAHPGTCRHSINTSRVLAHRLTNTRRTGADNLSIRSPHRLRPVSGDAGHPRVRDGAPISAPCQNSRDEIQRDDAGRIHEWRCRRAARHKNQFDGQTW